MKLSQLTDERQQAATLVTDMVVAAKLAICEPKNTDKGESDAPEELAAKLYEEVGEVIDAASRKEAIREAGDVMWTLALYVWRRWGVDR